MTKLQLGLNQISSADYHADRQFLSSSVLKKIYEDPSQYYKEYILGEAGPSISNQAALIEGSATHTIILEPHLFNEEFVVYEGLRKSGEAYDKFVQSMEPTDRRSILSKPQLMRVRSYEKAFYSRPEAAELTKTGFAEQTICAMLHGVPVKIRCDFIDPERGIIADIKTTGKPASLDIFKETLEGLKYHLSGALYCAVAEQYYGRPFTFYFQVISKQDLLCDVYKLSESSRRKGDEMVKKACELYKTCLKSNNWNINTEAEVSNEDSGYKIEEV